MATLKEAQEKHEAAVETNRAVGVVDYQAPTALSERVFEVEEGLAYLPTEEKGKRKILGPGNRFRPTEAQVKGGALKGKARELTGTEYAGLKASPTQVAGADIGIRALPITGHVLKLALDHNVTEGELRAIAPAGPGGNYTKAQIEEIVSKRAN